MNRLQKTLREKVTFSGKGLHTGRLVRLEIFPAEANTGIQFLRVDNPHAKPILANVVNVSSTEHSTSVGSGANSVSTIEHLMAAFVALEIDNALVKINGPEVPIMDGSSGPFYRGMLKVGVQELAFGQRYFVIKKTFTYSDNGRSITIKPQAFRSISCVIDFGNSFIGKQATEFDFSSFENLLEARTFCHYKEINALRSVGLALGGSLDNAVVVGETGVLNEEGLRSENEFVEHKLLDCIGDFALLGAPLIGRIEIFKPGHGFHVAALNELLMHKDEYLTVVEAGAFRKNPQLEVPLPVGIVVATYG